MSDIDTMPALSATDWSALQENIAFLQRQLERDQVDKHLLKSQLESVQRLLTHLQHQERDTLRTAHLQTLVKIGGMIGSSLDLQTVLNSAMDAILALTKGESGFILMLNADDRLETVVARQPYDESVDQALSRYSHTIARTVLTSGVPLLTTNATEDPRFSSTESIASRAIKSIMVAPLRSRGDIIGVCYVQSRLASGLFNEHDLSALEMLSGQIAMAIENARLFQATDQELTATVARLSLLRKIDLKLLELLNIDKAMEFVIETVVRLSHAQSGRFVLLRGMDNDIFAEHVYGMDPNIRTEKPFFNTYPHHHEALRSTQPIFFPPHPNTSIQSVLLLRMKTQSDTLVGLLAIHQADESTFLPSEVELVQQVINRAATTIENASLYAAVQNANQAKSEFVSFVAHDLKVPMHNILGFATLARDVEQTRTEQNIEILDFMDTIIEVVEDMHVLVSDITDINRLESGTMRIEPRPTDLKALLHVVKERLKLEINKREHRLIEQIPAQLPLVMVDYHRMIQVLINLMSNAIKYTPNGGTLTLDVQVMEASVRIAISDTGIGMSQQDLQKLGQKFFRSSDSFARRQSGSGLGVAITKQLINMMGGQLTLQSQVGVGSTFSFTIHLVKA